MLKETPQLCLRSFKCSPDLPSLCVPLFVLAVNNTLGKISGEQQQQRSPKTVCLLRAHWLKTHFLV